MRMAPVDSSSGGKRIMTSCFRSNAALAQLFAYITARFGDASCEHPQNAEAWQYFGTYDGAHEFRHRDLPADIAAKAGVLPGRTYYTVSRGIGTVRQ